MSASIHPSLPAPLAGQRAAVPEHPTSSPDRSGTVSHFVAHAREAGCAGAPEKSGGVWSDAVVTAATMVLLKAIAAYERLTVAQLVAELADERARAVRGLAPLRCAVADLNGEAGRCQV